MKKIPVALFTYNRPNHLLRTLTALESCTGRKHFDFHFFSDAAKAEKDREAVQASRLILENFADRFSAEKTYRQKNLGLANSIVTGVDRLVSRYGRVVVLEDDLIVRPEFLLFMKAALQYYEEEESVMQVGGCSLAPPADWPFDAYILPVTTTWGWGTWARAWEKFTWTPNDWPSAASDRSWYDLFRLYGAYNYPALLEQQLKRDADSWGILWWYAVSRAGGLTIYPKTPLVANHGQDGTGIHKHKIASPKQISVATLQDNRELPRETYRFPNTLFYERSHLMDLIDEVKLLS